jgi:pimeloyl-ACP methyl ester carboxylesterase
MNFSEHRYRSHDGLSLYYRSYGNADDVVLCLPGLTRNCRDFEDLAVHLSHSWRVISPDFRGRGRSDHDPLPRRYHPGSYAKDTWTLLDGEGIRYFTVIGTSLGGLTAMVMADQQAERIRGVVINDIGPEIPSGAAARILQYVGRIPPAPDWETAIARFRANYEHALPGLSDAFWGEYIRRSYREDDRGRPVPDMDPAVGEALRRAQRMTKILRCLRRVGLLRRLGGINIDPWDSFGAMSMPCLVVHGARSDVLDRQILERMQRVKPDLETVTLRDRGHAPLLDESLALEAIDDFLARVAETAADGSPACASV